MHWIKQLRRKIPRHISFYAIALLALFVSFYLKSSNYLFPGPLSAVNMQGQELQGYQSHAEFEMECMHCHAPVHCITDTHCQDCHMDVAEQRSSVAGLHGKLPGVQRCQDCHKEHAGREANITEFAFANVDHEALAGFSLALHQQDYAGEPLNCESCHQQERFATQRLDCVSCHAQADHDGMAAHLEQFGQDCLACHDGQDRMSDFDHNLVYPLEGAHADLPCEACHQEYGYTCGPLTCNVCHADPEIHLGLFGLDCERCHTASAWQPAELTRHDFRLDHGGEGQVACETCHVATYQENTCYGCHDHQPADMEQVHLAEGLPEYEDCQACHPTGAAGEAARQRETQAALEMSR